MRADAVAQSAQMVVGHISAAVSEVQMCHVDMVASQQTHEEAQRSRAEMRKLLQVREERHSHVEHELFELQNSFATLQDHMALSQERCAAAAEQTAFGCAFYTCSFEKASDGCPTWLDKIWLQFCLYDALAL